MNLERNDFVPCKIIKVYQQQNKDNYYLELHNVIRDKNTNKLMVGSGRPLQRKTMGRLLSAVHSNEVNSYFKKPLIDIRLLSCEPLKYKRHILWYDKPMLHPMIFSDRFGLEDGKYHFPAMLYFVSMDTIRFFAMKTGNKRPVLSTKLYHAPMFNTINDNTICWGSVKKDTSGITEIDSEMDAWDTFIWQSKFSHGGNGVTTKEDLVKIFKKTKDGNRKFPLTSLIDTKMVLGDLFDKYL